MVRLLLKASLNGKEVSCDRCGHVDLRRKFVTIYFGPHGEKVDFCPKCFDREVRK
ncbi:MAG: hypothetical protein QXM43_03450 [Desulfurococcaceae archaeon]